MPRKPKPVPPIYQPEVAAEAIFWAAHNERRELSVGWPTVRAIVGDKVAPGFADRYLASTGYDAQQRDEPVEPDRADNLFEPLPGDHGAHGEFDDGSRARTLQLWMNERRGRLAAAAALSLLLGRRRG